MRSTNASELPNFASDHVCDLHDGAVSSIVGSRSNIGKRLETRCSHLFSNRGSKGINDWLFTSRIVDMQHLTGNEMLWARHHHRDDSIANAWITKPTLRKSLGPGMAVEAVCVGPKGVDLSECVIELAMDPWLGILVLENKVIFASHVLARASQLTIEDLEIGVINVSHRNDGPRSADILRPIKTSMNH